MHFSVLKLLSIAAMTYTYVYHLRNLRPANLLRTQLINFIMRRQHVRTTHDPTVVLCLLSRKPLRIPAQTILPETRVLNYITAAIIWVCLYLLLPNCFRKPLRKDVQDGVSARPHCPLTSFLENPTEYPHKPYVARN